MLDLVSTVLNSRDEKTALHQVLGQLRSEGGGKQDFLRNEILQAFASYCDREQKPSYFYHASTIGQLMHYTHEILLENGGVWLLVRAKIASQEICRLPADLSRVEKMPPRDLLELRDRLANRSQPQILELDFGPFCREMPTIHDPRDIGGGLAFLNHYLCDQLPADPHRWQEALLAGLKQQHYDGLSLLVNERIQAGNQLSPQVKKAIQLVNQISPNEPWETFRFQLQELGFDPGWGKNASRVRETLELLDRLLDAPEPPVLQAFLSRLPGIFRAALVSVHGWVAQEGVLGRSETAGQVVYVLNQARNLENQLRQEMELAGLDSLGVRPQVVILTRLIPNGEGTPCSQRLEKINGTENGWLLRVPFVDGSGEVSQNWISKFEIWPYLEAFALEAERELPAHLGGKPDLIVGNYSDGNLVAFLLARRFQAVQCNIAHSLEKSKYLFSDLYWQELEKQYHFSAQFTADLIAMNGADFIIASSYQEIVGSPDSLGQYESYKHFSLPQLYHVVDGIELFSPKFNVIPPGVNEHLFFPYTQEERRLEGDRQRVRDLLFSQEDGPIWGHLEEPSKRPIFSLGPLSSIKNLAGLVECFARSEALRECCNLILVLGKLRQDEASTEEERQELERLWQLADRYQIQGSCRWLGMTLSGTDLGEAYRAIADCRGIFVQFSRLEAFGIALLEAGISGLPCFTTEFGGSQEIIEEEVTGFYLNPTDLAGSAQKMVQFFQHCQADPEYWLGFSQQAIARVREKYNWQDNAQKLLLLAKISRFWQAASPGDREPLYRYLEALFHLIYKPRAKGILDFRF